MQAAIKYYGLEGPAYDLSITVGILITTEQIHNTAGDSLFVEELSLDGTVRHTNGLLQMIYSSTLRT